MTPADLSKDLRDGKTVFGTLIVSPSPRWPEVVRGCGLDFVFIDTEHIALDRAQLSWMCQTYAVRSSCARSKAAASNTCSTAKIRG
jgi:2-keto-3-deoxy-L-rhamnonate aldolase RhmA